MESYRLGRGLRQGDTIAIVAPAAPLAAEAVTGAEQVLRDLGYVSVLGRTVEESWGYLAGSDELRARDLEWAFADPAVQAILCLRGGYGTTRFLDLLDYDRIRANPKLFIGFSDITALHTVFRQRCAMATIHGPMALSLGREPTAYTLGQFAAGLQEPVPAGPLQLPPGRQLEPLVPGTASGTLCGGNMMLLSVTTGTPYALDGTDGLLLLEEIGEDAYALDRMLRQFEQSGLIARAAGILFGTFHDCMPTESRDGEFTVREVAAYYAERWGKPALWGVPAGHEKDNAWLPFGVPARMEVGVSEAVLTIEKVKEQRHE